MVQKYVIVKVSMNCYGEVNLGYGRNFNLIFIVFCVVLMWMVCESCFFIIIFGINGNWQRFCDVCVCCEFGIQLFK